MMENNFSEYGRKGKLGLVLGPALFIFVTLLPVPTDSTPMATGHALPDYAPKVAPRLFFGS